MKKFFLSLVLALMAVSLFAQAKKVTGTVLDADNGEPLIGVSVVEKGTTNGIVTDLDGNFTLQTKDENAILSFSYVGYASQEVRVKKNASMGVISLKAEAIGLSDVTVTGQIAVQRKTPVAVSQVTALEIEERLGGGEFVEVLKHTRYTCQ